MLDQSQDYFDWRNSKDFVQKYQLLSLTFLVLQVQLQGAQGYGIFFKGQILLWTAALRSTFHLNEILAFFAWRF